MDVPVDRVKLASIIGNYTVINPDDRSKWQYTQTARGTGWFHIPIRSRSTAKLTTRRVGAQGGDGGLAGWQTRRRAITETASCHPKREKVTLAGRQWGRKSDTLCVCHVMNDHSTKKCDNLNFSLINHSDSRIGILWKEIWVLRFKVESARTSSCPCMRRRRFIATKALAYRAVINAGK